MIILFAIVGHFINYEYSNTFSEHSQMIIYGLHPDYKNNFEYPTSCNQYQIIDQNMDDIKYILDLDWKIYNTNGYFNFWQSEYLNRDELDENYKNEFDFFVNYLIIKNNILNISNQYGNMMKDLYVKYGINIVENTDNINLDYYEEIENEINLNNIDNIGNINNIDKINKSKYDKITFTYDVNYLNRLFEYESFETTLKFKSLYEIWKCSI
jgi:hypothetical protein